MRWSISCLEGGSGEGEIVCFVKRFCILLCYFERLFRQHFPKGDFVGSLLATILANLSSWMFCANVKTYVLTLVSETKQSGSFKGSVCLLIIRLCFCRYTVVICLHKDSGLL